MHHLPVLCIIQMSVLMLWVTAPGTLKEKWRGAWRKRDQLWWLKIISSCKKVMICNHTFSDREGTSTKTISEVKLYSQHIRKLCVRDLSCGMNLLHLLHPSYFLTCQALLPPTPSSHPPISSNFSSALWSHSTLLLWFPLHPVPYFRHAFEVPNVPAHLHSFLCISHLPCPGKQWAALSTSLKCLEVRTFLPSDFQIHQSTLYSYMQSTETLKKGKYLPQR